MQGENLERISDDHNETITDVRIGNSTDNLKCKLFGRNSTIWDEEE